MNIEQAIQQFRNAAIEKGDYAVPAKRDHALYRVLVKAWCYLDEQGANGRDAFKALLKDESEHVRGWVASQLLALGDTSVVPLLEAEAKAGGLSGLSAKTVLSEWRAGRLGLPFGKAKA